MSRQMQGILSRGHGILRSRLRLTSQFYVGFSKGDRPFSSLMDPEESEERCCLELFQCGATGRSMTKDELKCKYLELAKQMHPDVGDEASVAAFQRLQHCFELLYKKTGPMGQTQPEWLRKLREDYATSKDPFP